MRFWGSPADLLIIGTEILFSLFQICWVESDVLENTKIECIPGTHENVTGETVIITEEYL